MKSDEAAALFNLVRAAFPEGERVIGEDTAGLWIDELRRQDPAVGESAVRGVIASVRRRWPVIADLNEHVTIAKEQRQRQELERVQAEARAREAEEAAVPRPALRDIPAAREFLERWVRPTPDALEQVEDGACDDGCDKTGERWRIGRFEVCAECAARRQRAGEKAKAVDLAPFLEGGSSGEHEPTEAHRTNGATPTAESGEMGGLDFPEPDF